MKPPPRLLVSLCLAGLLVASGCTGPGPTGVPRTTKRSAATKAVRPPAAGAKAQLAALAGLEKLVVPQTGQQVALTGKVKLISDQGGAIISDNGGGLISDQGGAIISDNGGGIISNNSGSIISDNGGGLISNNGGGLVSNNGGGLTAKTKYGLAQVGAGGRPGAGGDPGAGGLAVYRLADAVIALHDAAGRVLVDEAGQPLTATTGADGAYTLTATLPPGNLVAKIRLWNGGELAAMVVRDAAGALTLDLDTASTMGAAYVLGRFVKGDQGIFDRLPRGENERLTRELDVVRGYLKAAFKYDADLLAEATDALRARVPAVDRTIEDVRALLLGQANLGGGRRATEVALSDLVSLDVRRDGTLLIAERFVGRIRAVGPDGLLSTIADGAFGRIKRNFPSITEVIEGPDGALYACAFRVGNVYRLADDGEVTVLAGTGKPGREAIGAPLATPLVPRSLAFGPDGTLYIGENRGGGADKLIPPRLLALEGGRLEAVAGATFPPGNLQAIAASPDGTLHVLHHAAGSGTLYRLAQGVLTPLAADLGCQDASDMVRGADGTLYVAEEANGQLTAFAPDGTRRALTGAAAEGGGRAIRVPCALGIGPDGTLYLGDQATNLVHARDPAGAWRVVAGTQAVQQQGDLTSFAISLPGGLAVDADGSLLVAEGGSHTVKRFRDGRLEIVVGGLRGGSGDGGPATEARISAPTGIALHEGALWLLDTGNRSLRRVAPDGTISTRAGKVYGQTRLAVGESGPALEMDLAGGVELAFAPDGRPYWTDRARGQIWRLSPGASGEVVEAVLGRVDGGAVDAADFSALLTAPFDPNPATFQLPFPMGLVFDRAGDLFVADAVTCRIYKLSAPGTPAARLEIHAGLSAAELFAKAAAQGPDTPPPGAEGEDAKQASFVIPTGLAFDPAGNMYVAEAGTNNLTALSSVFSSFPLDPALLPQVPARVRRIGLDGKVTTIAGPGGKFFTDPAAEDALALPTAVALDKAGRLVIIDSGANLIRILPAGSF